MAGSRGVSALAARSFHAAALMLSPGNQTRPLPLRTKRSSCLACSPVISGTSANTITSTSFRFSAGNESHGTVRTRWSSPLAPSARAIKAATTSRPASPDEPSTQSTETRSRTTATVRRTLSAASLSPLISAVMRVAPALWNGTNRETDSEAPPAIRGMILRSISTSSTRHCTATFETGADPQLRIVAR